MTTNIAGTKGKPAPRVRPATEILVGQTFRKLRLSAGWRPFAVVSVDTSSDRASGWLFLDPERDAHDEFLRQQGIQAAARRQPCYITVPTDLIK